RRMMKGLLLNDTRIDPNPGCQATVSSLLRLLASAGIDLVATLPVGYGYHHYAELVGLGKNHDPDAWYAVVSGLTGDRSLFEAIDAADGGLVTLGRPFAHQH